MAKNPQSLRRLDDLIAAGLASAGDRAALEQVAARYAVAITPGLAECIDPGDPADPVGRQFVPDPRELDVADTESADPIADDPHSPVEGLVHRYPDRVLLKLTHVCAVYCRFCFRREMVGPAGRGGLTREELAGAFDYIRTHPEIWEVILTGGDPLVLSPRRLKAVAAELAAIDHVKVMRIHTRMPVATPERVTPALIRALKASGKALYVVLHVNHARELSLEVRAACARLVDAGVPMLSQSVLLRGVNDDPASLGELMRTLVESRIKPYYLHHGDLAPGTAHWRTTIEEGRALLRALHGHYSGLCQPSYVLDIPGGHGKSPIGPCYLTQTGTNGSARYEVEDYRGRRHAYPPVAAPKR